MTTSQADTNPSQEAKPGREHPDAFVKFSDDFLQTL